MGITLFRCRVPLYHFFERRVLPDQRLREIERDLEGFQEAAEVLKPQIGPRTLIPDQCPGFDLPAQLGALDIVPLHLPREVRAEDVPRGRVEPLLQHNGAALALAQEGVNGLGRGGGVLRLLGPEVEDFGVIRGHAAPETFQLPRYAIPLGKCVAAVTRGTRSASCRSRRATRSRSIALSARYSTISVTSTEGQLEPTRHPSRSFISMTTRQRHGSSGGDAAPLSIGSVIRTPPPFLPAVAAAPGSPSRPSGSAPRPSSARPRRPGCRPRRAPAGTAPPLPRSAGAAPAGRPGPSRRGGSPSARAPTRR